MQRNKKRALMVAQSYIRKKKYSFKKMFNLLSKSIKYIKLCQCDASKVTI